MGFAALLKTRRRLGVFVLLAFVTVCVFVLNYRVPDVQVFAIPAFLLLAVGLGVGIQAGWRMLWGLTTASKRINSRAAGALVAGALCIVLLLNFLALWSPAWAANDLSGRTGVRDMGRDWLRQDFPSGARVVGILGEMTL